MEVAVIILLVGLVGANLYVMYGVGEVLRDLLREVRKLNEGIDALRLTSRTRIGTIKPALGAHAKERQSLVRLGRISSVKRVLVGGDQDHEELREAGRELASQREEMIARGANPADLEVPLAPYEPDGVEDE